MSVRFKEFNPWQEQPSKETPLEEYSGWNPITWWRKQPRKKTPLEEAAAFASELEPERLINISHARYPAGLGGWYLIDIVTVWYWDGD